MAHIDTGATVEQVTRQVASVVRRPRRTAANTTSATVVTAAAAEQDAEVAALFGDAEVQAVREQAEVTIIGDTPRSAVYSPEKLVQYIDACIEADVAKYSQNGGEIREALNAFINLCQNHPEVPGPILLNRFGGFFKDPAHRRVWRKPQSSMFGTCISSILSILSKSPEV